MANLNRLIIRVVMCVALAGTWLGVSGQDGQEELDLYLDSLSSVYNNMPDGIEKLLIVDEISLKHYNVDSTVKYASLELELAKNLHEDYYAANAKRFLGWCYCQIDEFEQSISYFNDAVHDFESLSDSYGLAMSYYGLANSKYEYGDDSDADKYYMKASKMFESLGEYEKLSSIYRNMASVRADYHIYESANGLISKAFALDSLRGDSASLAEDYYQLGVTYKKHYADIEMPYFLFSAKEQMLKGYELAGKHGSSLILLWMTHELMFLYQDIGKIQTGEERRMSLDSAYYFYKVADSLINVCSVYKQRIYLDIWEANSLCIEGKYDQARDLLKEIEQRPKLIGENKLYIYRSMIFVCESSGDYSNALKYTKMLYRVDKETYNREFAVRATSVEYEYALHEEDMARERQMFIITIVTICFVMVSVLAIVILRGFLRNRKLNRQLALRSEEIMKKNEELNIRNAEILSQRDEIEVQRDNIEITSQMLMDSINYAKHIQDAVMTSHDTMHKLFGDTLIYWKPMNVVSGDFYWAMQKDNLKLLVLADCTGHGVPGAFMSMFSISSLNSIVSPLRFSNIKASEILDMLRAKIIGELHQTTASGDAIESIDMAFCIIDTTKMQMQYAGANRPLVLVRDGKLSIYKPDKMSVGLHIMHNAPFTNNVIDLKKGDAIYLYTDGVTDQFGAVSGNVSTGKYTAKRLDNLLQNISDKPFAEQRNVVDKAISDWRTMDDGSVIDQYDDQLLLGVKIS